MKVQWSERGNEWEAEGGTRRVCVSTGSERKQMGERAWDQARRRRSRGVHTSSGGMKKGRATGVRVHVLGEGCGLEAQGGSIAGSHVRSAGLPLRGCFFTTNPRSSSCLNIAQASSPSSDVVGGRRRRMEQTNSSPEIG